MLQQTAIPLSQIFGDAIYQVPEYQRSYSWTTRQLQDLWDDLQSLATTESGNSARHFMGTLIRKPVPQGQIQRHGKVYQRFEVIDGQQRLTSLVTLLSTICKSLRGSHVHAGTVDNIYDQFIAYCRNGITDRQLRKLRLGAQDDDYFWDVILDPDPIHIDPQTPGQRRLLSAQRFFEEKIATWSHEGLVRFAEQIQPRVLMLCYQVADELEAGHVFETTNDRGKSLSQLDKIKSYLMYLAAKTDHTNLSGVVNSRWGELLRSIAKVDPNSDDTEEEEGRLARYQWIMESGNHRAYEIHREIKASFPLTEGDSAERATDYMKRLAEAGELYIKILRPKEAVFAHNNAQQQDEIRKILVSLNRVGTVANFVPLLMAGLSKLEDDPEAYRDISLRCFLLAWRAYGICGRRTDAGIADLSSLAHSLARGARSPREICHALEGHIKYHASDNELTQSLALNRLSGLQRRFFLYSWEVDLCRRQQQQPVGWDECKTYQIEHIWPQNPQGLDGWPDEIVDRNQRLVDQLGNLALVPPPWNPQLSNRPLFEKRQTYSNSNLAMLRRLPPEIKEICNLESAYGVSPEVLSAVEAFVNTRTQKLVEFALSEWQLPPTTPGP